MRYLFESILLLVIASSLLISIKASVTNTTDFFKAEMNNQTLSYQSFAGYQDVDWYFKTSSAAIYYSLWQGSYQEWTNKTVPLIIWLQGGPGAPSQFGCFNQIGPLHISGNGSNFKPIENPFTWNSYGHVMCVDQPIGVGFSYNKNLKKVDNTRDAADHFINFLANFYKNTPQFNLKNNPLYIAGESYAGHYIPAIAEKILKNGTLGFNLKGVMIGDGWVDPIHQNNNFDSYLNSVGAVSNYWRDTTTFMQNEAITRIMNGDLKEASNYTNFIIADDMVANKYYNGMNVLNYKQYDDGNINVDYWRYLNAKKKFFGVPDGVQYVDNNQEMYYAFCDDLSKSFKSSLDSILTLNVKTLIYNGQNDMIVNTPGVLEYLNTLQWQYVKNWKNKEKVVWREYGGLGEHLGWYKNYRNLIFVMVRNAGHLVPSDQPRTAYLMLREYFVGDQW